MAFAQGLTATDHVDYLEKLVTFLSSDANLVAAGEDWDVIQPFTLGIAELTSEFTPLIGLPENAFDKDPSTNIQYSTTAGAGSIIVDFGRGVPLTGLSMDQGAPADATLSYWDGAVWQPAITNGGLDAVSYYKWTFATVGSYTRWKVSWTALQPGNTYFKDWRLYVGVGGVDELSLGTAVAALQAPGIVGYTRPYVEFRLVQDTADSYYNLLITQGTYIGGTPGNLSQPAVLRLQNGGINYWIAANGRRVVSVAVFAGTSESLYAGLYLPYSPAQYHPYPGFVGGTTQTDEWETSYLSGSDRVRPWFDPSPGVAFIFTASNAWLSVNNWDTWGTARRGNPYNGTAWNSSLALSGAVSPLCNFSLMDLKSCIAPPGAEHTLMPLVPFFMDRNAPEEYGELEGCFWVPGRGVASEDVITDGGTDYVIFQAAHHTEFDNFFALKME